jgi:NADH:ubiquinone oxidoreductase subunit E
MKQHDVIKFIKSQRLRWVAHVIRMENTRTTRKITEWTPYKTRPVGRPRLRWMDQVEGDLKRMKIIG